MAFRSPLFVKRSRAQQLGRIFTSTNHLTATKRVSFTESTMQKAKLIILLTTMLLLLPLRGATSQMAGNKDNQSNLTLSEKQASHFAALALKCVNREFPNNPEHVINDAADVKNPKLLHPAFYECYDWHSSVHGHWMLVRLLRTFPGLPEAGQIRKALNANLAAENGLAGAAYFKQPNRQSFERTYGWAWLLKLAEELHSWNDVEGKSWSASLQPLVDV